MADQDARQPLAWDAAEADEEDGDDRSRCSDGAYSTEEEPEDSGSLGEPFSQIGLGFLGASLGLGQPAANPNPFDTGPGPEPARPQPSMQTQSRALGDAAAAPAPSYRPGPTLRSGPARSRRTAATGGAAAALDPWAPGQPIQWDALGREQEQALTELGFAPLAARAPPPGLRSAPGPDTEGARHEPRSGAPASGHAATAKASTGIRAVEDAAVTYGVRPCSEPEDDAAPPAAQAAPGQPRPRSAPTEADAGEGSAGNWGGTGMGGGGETDQGRGPGLHQRGAGLARASAAPSYSGVRGGTHVSTAVSSEAVWQPNVAIFRTSAIVNLGFYLFVLVECIRSLYAPPSPLPYVVIGLLALLGMSMIGLNLVVLGRLRRGTNDPIAASVLALNLEAIGLILRDGIVRPFFFFYVFSKYRPGYQRCLQTSSHDVGGCILIHHSWTMFAHETIHPFVVGLPLRPAAAAIFWSLLLDWALTPWLVWTNGGGHTLPTYIVRHTVVTLTGLTCFTVLALHFLRHDRSRAASTVLLPGWMQRAALTWTAVVHGVIQRMQHRTRLVPVALVAAVAAAFPSVWTLLVFGTPYGVWNTVGLFVFVLVLLIGFPAASHHCPLCSGDAGI